MTVKQFVVITRAEPGAEQEFDRWYDEVHLEDVIAVPGITKATRFRILSQGPAAFETPVWYSIALYEIDSDDPQAVISEINKRWQNGQMSISEALDADILLQFLAEPTRTVVKRAL